MKTVTDAEKMFCMYKLNLEGSGMTALITAIFALDVHNRSKVALGFPELVRVVERYKNEDGYWQDLATRWNENSYLKVEA